jgi:thymidylate kinase
MFISFSGIDGAGKSTQIDNLVSHLRSAGLTVSIVTFWDDVVMLKNLREGAGHKVFKGDKGVGSPEAPIQRRDKNVRSPVMTAVRMAFYLLDALSLRRVARQARQSSVNAIIFDRYIFDELANLELSNPFARLYIRALMKLIPRPDISFFLDANPDQAFARKPEYPLDFLHSNRNAYLRLAQTLGGITVVPPGSIGDAKTLIVGRVMQTVPAQLLADRSAAQ